LHYARRLLLFPVGIVHLPKGVTMGKTWKWADGTESADYVRRWNDRGEDVATGQSKRGKLPRVGIAFGGSLEGDARIYDAPKRGTLRMILRATEYNRNRLNARKGLRSMRIQAAADRRVRREAEAAAIAKAPLVALRDDVRDGRIPNASAWKVETRKVTLRNRDGSEWKRHYAEYVEEVRGSVLQLERLHSDYASVRRVSEACMRREDRKCGNVSATRPWKRSRYTTTVYLTAADLQRITDSAIGGYVEADTNERGITCVRYFRNRHSRVEGIVRRHLREAAA